MGWVRNMFISPKYQWVVFKPPTGTVANEVEEAYRQVAPELAAGLRRPFPSNFKPFGPFWLENEV